MIKLQAMISYQFKKNRIGYGLVFFSLLIISGIWFIFEPEIFIRNFLMKKEHIQIVGILGIFYGSLMIFAFIFLIFNKKDALIISDNYLIDNSKYESIGKIHFSEIKHVKRIKKNSLEIVLKESVLKNKKLNILQRILLMINNWNYKNSIIISCALMNCKIEELETEILSRLDRNKHR